MRVNELLVESFGRLSDLVGSAVEELSAEQLRWAPKPGANTVGWLVWHLTRVQDHHLAELIDGGGEQLWVTGDWASRFGLKADPDDNGYGHTAEQVLAVRPDGPDTLVGYFEAVSQRTIAWLGTLTEQDLDRVVDERWDPPVTLGVRLVSV